jgi:site-specific recombinase XerD
MKQVFSAHQLCEQDGPLGPYIESFDAEMRGEGYARQTREVQTRLVADFGCWLAKRGIRAQDITAELFRPYLRARARRRRPTRNDLSALQRLLELLRRQGVVAAAVLPVATPAQRLLDEFRLYLRQERALASTTVVAYTAFVSEFLTERFGAGSVNLSRLCAADITRFVRRRAGTIQSKRVQLMTTALRSFLRFARYRGDINKNLAACIPAVANWKQSTLPRALPPDQVEQVLNSVDRKTAMGRRDYAILLILARLGLRAGEIRALTLEDLDWKEGLITVRGRLAAFPSYHYQKTSGRRSPTICDMGGRLPIADAFFFARKRPPEVSRGNLALAPWSDMRWSGLESILLAKAPTSSGTHSLARCSSREPRCLRSANSSGIAARRPPRFTPRWTWIRLRH